MDFGLGMQHATSQKTFINLFKMAVYISSTQTRHMGVCHSQYSLNYHCQFDQAIVVQEHNSYQSMLFFQLKAYLEDPSAFAVAAPAADTAAPAAAVEEKKKEESEEESDEDMGFGLFD